MCGLFSGSLKNRLLGAAAAVRPHPGLESEAFAEHRGVDRSRIATGKPLKSRKNGRISGGLPSP